MPVPYREALFQRLSERDELTVEIVYQASSQASWDQSEGWFPAAHGYAAVHLRPRQVARPGRSPITWPRGLEAALSAFAPDVVVVSEFGPATLRALAWCRARRRALVVLTEVTAAVELTLSRPQRLVHRWLARRVDGFVAVSSAARERLLALGAAPEAVTVSLQPVDEDALRDALAARRPVELAPVEVLAVARLVADKELGVLLDAFAEIDIEESEAALCIVGGGPLEHELRERAAALGVPASFSGAIGAAELPARYASAGVFVLPSRFEPFGVALREAVVAGLPVICSTAVGAAADFARDGVNAILVQPGDVAALAAALDRVCRDAGLRREMGAASSAVAAQHPLDADVESFAAAIKAAARAARARR